MNEKLIDILERIRNLALKHGIRNISMDDIDQKLGIPKDTLLEYVKSEAELVEKVLELERESFKVIFDEYDFEGMNAIDILLIVSKEIARKFHEVSPSITFDLKENFPEVYQDHFEKRIGFIFEKIKINIEKGIHQNMYRDDLSIELVARLYISRLIDIHNPDFFPPEKFSFQTLFDVMFDNFVRSIAKPEGIAYYEKRKKSINFNTRLKK